jgi:uncharacterized phage protein (TIGR02220 family)
MARRTVEDTFWTDPEVKKLSFLDKALFLYFITNPHAHISGIYYLPLSTVAEETGLSLKAIKDALIRLSSYPHILYDAEFSIIWVRKMLAHQAFNPKIKTGIEAHLRSLHKCPLIKEFLNYYHSLSIDYPYSIGYPIDTLSDRVSNEEKSNKKSEKFTNENYSNDQQTENLANSLPEQDRIDYRYSIDSLSDSLSYRSSNRNSNRNRNSNNNKYILSGKKSSSSSNNSFQSEKEEIIQYLNQLTQSSFKSNSRAANHITARLKEGFSVEECKMVIDNRVRKWLHDPKMREYLRPATLFNSEKFESYLAEERRHPVENVPKGWHGLRQWMEENADEE